MTLFQIEYLGFIAIYIFNLEHFRINPFKKLRLFLYNVTMKMWMISVTFRSFTILHLTVNYRVCYTIDLYSYLGRHRHYTIRFPWINICQLEALEIIIKKWCCFAMHKGYIQEVWLRKYFEKIKKIDITSWFLKYFTIKLKH